MSNLPLILGHRGASAVAPENTLTAFSRAIDAGADGIEFDVRLSRDGVPVVIHDASLKRTGLIDRLVSELSAQELRDIDVGSWWPGGEFAGERLPLLTEVFNLFRSNAGWLYVEMKCELSEGPALAAEVVRLTGESGLADRVVVESFEHASIAKVKEIDASIRTAALFEPSLAQPLSLVRSLKMVEKALEVGADEIALHYRLAGSRLVEKAKQEDLEVVLWTVDDPAWIPRAQKLGIKALIANDPALLLRHSSR